MSSTDLFAERKTLFVEVILPLSLAKLYTYRIPFEMSHRVQIGVRVIVQFGKNKIYAALVRTITDVAPEKYEAKYILDVVDDEPIVHDKQFELWDWISNYYMCHLGEVMQAALPAALKMASETKIIAADDPDLDRSSLSDKAFLVLDALDVAGELRISDVAKILGQKTVFPLIRSLFEKGFILISEEIKERYKPKIKTFLTLASNYADSEGLRLLLDELHRSPKQQDAVLAYIQLRKQISDVSRQDIMERAGVSAGVVKALVDKEVFEVQERVVSRLGGEDVIIDKNFVLNDRQQQALDQIQQHFEQQDVVLLHGVTASGKTQLYIRLIEAALAKEETVLYLLPEIALTAQITQRLKLHFGNKLGVYHSKFNDNERAEVWHKVSKGEFKIVIGARSSIFLPFQDLGLVIVDEEHENSYKQFEPAPRYHARDTAIYLAYLQGAKVLLGSATPSIESYYNAKSGKYGLVELLQRYGDAQLPQIEVVNIATAGRQDEMQSYFSNLLLRQIEEAVQRKEQIILFQNRRGHTTFLQCRTCGYVAKCVNCDVSMTYHKTSDMLHCHYCGHNENPINVCPACGMPHLESKGYGTERIEEELGILMSNIRIGRLDLDSTRGKHGFDKVIAAFDDHEFDVLIGTQMVAKGLDFGRVSLIGIINADGIINFPDFRAYERAFSLFEQVSGRAGRRDQEGKVIIQTYSPQHPVIEQVLQHDYEGMFMREVTERKNFDYPPFVRLIRLDIKHGDQQQTHYSAQQLAKALRVKLGARVLGPEPPLVSRVRNKYIQNITLKIERTGINISKVKDFIKEALILFELDKKNAGVQVQIDVDPY